VVLASFTDPRLRGFTLIELMIAVAILAILASIAVPQYASAIRTARVAKARQELVTIAQAVDAYMANNAGQLPLTLYQVGFGGKRDPWGVPYCYLNYGDGTGDGLQWAIDAGILDPSAVQTPVAPAGGGSAGSGGGGNANGNANGNGNGNGTPRRAAFLPILSRRGGPQQPSGNAVERAGDTANSHSAVARAAAAAVVATLAREQTPNEASDLAMALAEAGTYAIYTGVAVETTRRRDKYMFPLNSDYDLFSLGPDLRTAVALGSPLGQDDVIRANNGGFFGPASQY
jgi:general secretion pathway protein G